MDTRTPISPNPKTMVSLKFSEIPHYLHGGAFYRALDEDDTKEIEVPEDSFKVDDAARSLDDFEQLLRTYLFWALDKIPIGMIDFCIRNHFSAWERSPECALRGDIETKTFEDLVELFRGESWCFLKAAVEKERTEVVEYLVQSDWCKFVKTATGAAARLGRLDYLMLMHQKGYAWNNDTCSEAAGEGHLHCLKYAHENRAHWDTRTLVKAAAGGHMDCLMYAIEKGLELHASACTAAVQKNRPHVLQYLHEQHCPWDENVTFEAANRGHTQCLQYALSHGCEVAARAATAVCRNGAVHILRMLHDYQAPWDSEASVEAASWGHLECLQYLHEHGCTWGANTPNVAVTYGAATTLQFAITHGCPHGEDLMRRAAWGGHLPCLQFLVEQGLYMNEDGSVFGAALRRGHFECMEYLLDQNCPFAGYVFADPPADLTPAFTVSEEAFYKSMVLALERGWRLNENLIRFVCQSRFAQCVEYLVAEGHVSQSNARTHSAHVNRFSEYLTYAPLPKSVLKRKNMFLSYKPAQTF